MEAAQGAAHMVRRTHGATFTVSTVFFISQHAAVRLRKIDEDRSVVLDAVPSTRQHRRLDVRKPRD